jgi:hypothetical protein
MTNSNTTLTEVELDLVSGGVRDNPWSDATNQQIAAQNGAEGTLGGSLNNVIVGLVPPMGSGDPYSPGHPFDWP